MTFAGHAAAQMPQPRHRAGSISLTPSLLIWGTSKGQERTQIRQEAHNLVLFYLGKMTQQQVAVNRHLVSTINRLTVQLQEQQQEIRSLREKIEQAD